MAAPAPDGGTYVIGRQLDDGHVEFWETRQDHATPTYSDPNDADAAASEGDADPDTWSVYALVEMTAATGVPETGRDPVILASHAGYTLAEQVRAVWDEEGPDGVADAIRRSARRTVATDPPGERHALAAAVANVAAHLGIVGDTEQKRRDYHVARIDALRDIEMRLRKPLRSSSRQTGWDGT